MFRATLDLRCAVAIYTLLLQRHCLVYAALPWHCLYFLPEPHGQGSLRRTCARYFRGNAEHV
jgi:hypothetical protein